MAIEKKTTLYELLIRFDEDGKFKGAHAIDLVTFVDAESGEKSPSKELPAGAITVKEAGSLLGAENVKLIEAADLARAQAAETENECNGVKAELEQARTSIAELETSLAGVNARLEQIRSIAAQP